VLLLSAFTPLINLLIASAIHVITTSIAIIIAIPKLASSPWSVIMGGEGVWLVGSEDDNLLDWWIEQELKHDSYPCVKVSG
jgi:hypothetical protein